MTKKLKKALALLMALSMLTGVLGTATFAADEEEILPELQAENTLPQNEGADEGEPTMPPDEESNADENIAPAAEETGEPRGSQAPETEIPEESEGASCRGAPDRGYALVVAPADRKLGCRTGLALPGGEEGQAGRLRKLKRPTRQSTGLPK